MVLPHTGKDRAQLAAERVRKLLENLELRGANGEVCRLTVSAGIAAYEPGDDVASMTYRAESCLCLAKKHGRNCVEK